MTGVTAYFAPLFQIGDKVHTRDAIGYSFPFHGTVRAVFTDSGGATHVVVEFSHASQLLRIFKPAHLMGDPDA